MDENQTFDGMQTVDNDRIIKINIEEEMKSSYIDYSMSVIVARALPDVRDVMPTKIPNLLVNGGNGIAVGMATNMPTHNLGEVIDGCCAYIDILTSTPRD